MPLSDLDRTVSARYTSLRERFFSHVHMIPFHACWEWVGCGVRGTGYGQIRFKGRLLKAHRVSWEIHNGPIPHGMCVLHRCDNPGCVRPEHLWVGTMADNNWDRERKGRRDPYGGRTHCSHGHALTGSNVRIYARKPGYRARVCKACRRLAWHRRKGS